MALWGTLDKLGPMARPVEAGGVALAGMSGADPADPTTSGKRFVALTGRAAASAVRSARMGFAEEDLAHATPEAKRALERGLAELRRIVPKVTRAVLPADLPYGAMVGTVLGAEGATIFGELIDSGRVDELVDKRQAAGLKRGTEIR